MKGFEDATTARHAPTVAEFTGLAIMDDIECYLSASGRAESIHREVVDFLECQDEPVDGFDETITSLQVLRRECREAADAASRRIAVAVLRVHNIDGSRPWSAVGVRVGVRPFAYIALVEPGRIVEPYALGTSYAVKDARVIATYASVVTDLRMRPGPIARSLEGEPDAG
jgi:hypothetical protein